MAFDTHVPLSPRRVFPAGAIAAKLPSRGRGRYASAVAGLPEAIADEAGTLFHDTRLDAIDPDAHAPFVIQRVLDRGTLRSVRALLAYYGERRVRAFLEHGGARKLDPRTAALWMAYFRLSQAECTSQSSLARKSVFWTS